VVKLKQHNTQLRINLEILKQCSSNLATAKHEVTPKNRQAEYSSGGSSQLQTVLMSPKGKPGSSSGIEEGDPSCLFSQKVFLEQLDNSTQKGAGNRKKPEKGRAVLS